MNITSPAVTSPSYACEILRHELKSMRSRAGYCERAIADFRGKIETEELNLTHARAVIVEMEAALKSLESR